MIITNVNMSTQTVLYFVNLVKLVSRIKVYIAKLVLCGLKLCLDETLSLKTINKKK